jgi:hypothetical protein
MAIAATVTLTNYDDPLQTTNTQYTDPKGQVVFDNVTLRDKTIISRFGQVVGTLQPGITVSAAGFDFYGRNL